MVKEKHVHFTLSPDNPREAKIIDILDKLPNRQAKSFIISLIERQTELSQIASEIHALVLHFGLEVSFEKSTSKASVVNKETAQFPGQISMSDIEEQMPMPILKKKSRQSEQKQHNTEMDVLEEVTSKPSIIFNEDIREEESADQTSDIPDSVMGFIGTLNDWGDDDE